MHHFLVNNATDTQLVSDLKKIRMKLTPPGSWCQGFYGRDEHGKGFHATLPLGPQTIPETLQSMCLLTAIKSVTRRANVSDLVRGAIGHTAITIWNDALDRTQEQVLALLDEIIIRESAIPV